MSDERYPAEYEEYTMSDNVKELARTVVGSKIVRVESGPEKSWAYSDLVITLDSGKRVRMTGSGDCCAYTELDSFLLHPELVDHVITGVGTTDGYETWHIYADMGDVLELSVGWSEGSGYYGYGFDISVEEVGANE